MENDSSDSDIEILHEHIVTKKRTSAAVEEEAASDGDGDPVVKKKKCPENSSRKPTETFVEKESNGDSNDVLSPEKEMRLKTKQANIASNESPALLHNSGEIRSGNVPAAEQVEREANSEGKDGQEVTENRDSEGRQVHEKSSDVQSGNVPAAEQIEKEANSEGKDQGGQEAIIKKNSGQKTITDLVECEKEEDEEDSSDDSSTDSDSDSSTDSDSSESSESLQITSDPPVKPPSKLLFDHILSLEVVSGKWAEEQLSLISAKMEEEGHIGGTEASVSYEVAAHQALSELMSRYHRDFLDTLIVGAKEMGVDPEELGKKFLECFLEKNAEP